MRLFVCTCVYVCVRVCTCLRRGVCVNAFLVSMYMCKSALRLRVSGRQFHTKNLCLFISQRERVTVAVCVGEKLIGQLF